MSNIKENVTHLIKNSYNKPAANVILTSGTRLSTSTHIIHIQHSTGSPNQCKKAKEEIKDLWIGKGEEKVAIYRRHDCLVENAKECKDY